MPGIDAHQHFWKFDAKRDQWITDEMSLIRRDFLPGDLQSLLASNGLEGCVTIQSDQSEAENIFQLANAERHDFIRGVVGWTDLQAEDISEKLDYFSRFKKLKGFRHILQGEIKRDLMLQPDFLRGIASLQKHRYTYDILIYPDQLRFIAPFVSRFPQQKFVIDHMAKPHIRSQTIDEWKHDIGTVAAYENVSCKISGFVTEADVKHWSGEDFTPYFDAVVELFGFDRIIFGSDWPVCLLGGSYGEITRVVTNYFAAFSQDERDKFFGKNAVDFYNL